MPYHTPERKTEQALKTYLEAILGEFELNELQFTTRFSNIAFTEPRVEIFCGSCRPWEQEGMPYTGNWACDVTLRFVSHYTKGTDATAHDDYVGNVLDVLLMKDTTTGEDGAVAEINATQFEADLTVLALDIGERTNTVEEHSMITEQELVVYIKPSR